MSPENYICGTFFLALARAGVRIKEERLHTPLSEAEEAMLREELSRGLPVLVDCLRTPH